MSFIKNNTPLVVYLFNNAMYGHLCIHNENIVMFLGNECDFKVFIGPAKQNFSA